jgi:DNA-binding NarL/FixJ family response regulator
VAQCDDLARLSNAIDTWRGAILLFSSSMQLDPNTVIAHARAAGIRTIYIAENGSEVSEELARALDGVLFRSVAGPGLLECIRRVAAGQHSFQHSNVTSILAQDMVGARVRDRLTPKEIQIVALIVQGYKNKLIATQLNTKEQVIKNYLRSIYDKTGVSDRLELALFTIHHRVLAEAAANASQLLQQAKSA